MKTTLTLMMLLFVATLNAQVGPGAFASDCPTIEQQQAAYNQQKAASIVVRDTYTQQLQTYYQQLATYYNQLHKDNQQKAKDQQQKDKDAQQIAKDLQQIDKDTQLKQWELSIGARETIVKDREAEYTEMFNFCYELKLLLEKPNPTCGEISDHVKLRINHSGQSDGTNPGGTTQDNGGILNPHN